MAAERSQSEEKSPFFCDVTERAMLMVETESRRQASVISHQQDGLSAEGEGRSLRDEQEGQGKGAGKRWAVD